MEIKRRRRYRRPITLGRNGELTYEFQKRLSPEWKKSRRKSLISSLCERVIINE